MTTIHMANHTGKHSPLTIYFAENMMAGFTAGELAQLSSYVDISEVISNAAYTFFRIHTIGNWTKLDMDTRTDGYIARAVAGLKNLLDESYLVSVNMDVDNEHSPIVLNAPATFSGHVFKWRNENFLLGLIDILELVIDNPYMMSGRKDVKTESTMSLPDSFIFVGLLKPEVTNKLEPVGFYKADGHLEFIKRIFDNEEK